MRGLKIAGLALVAVLMLLLLALWTVLGTQAGSRWALSLSLIHILTLPTSDLV